jgi:hypothetical protein
MVERAPVGVGDQGSRSHASPRMWLQAPERRLGHPFASSLLGHRNIQNTTRYTELAQIGLRTSGRIRLGAKCVNMAKEIERKFLVKGDAWRAIAKGTTYRQGYLNSAKERTVRIRTADAQALTRHHGQDHARLRESA